MKFAIAFVACLFAAPAGASMLYDVHSCTPGVNCAVGSHGTSPGVGPTNADFRMFFTTQLGVDLSSDNFTWTMGSNANGYVFGTVDDTDDNIHTSYLWNSGGLMCCTVDAPYSVVDGNDHDLFIGAGAWNQSSPQWPWDAFIVSPGGPFALTAVPFDLTPHGMSVVGADLLSVQFTAIDNADRILAQWSQGWLEFDSVAAAVPEPASLLLLAPALLALRRRRTRP